MEKLSKVLAVLLIILVAAFAYFMSGLAFEGKEGDIYLPVVTGENISTYKNSCSELNLSQVSKDPFSLVGQKVKVNGQIQKKEEFEQFGNVRTSMVLKVPEISSNPYVLVSYSTTTEFKQGDLITVYGEYYYPAKDETVPELKNKDLPVIRTVYIEKA